MKNSSPNQQSYGLPQPISNVFPAPVIAQRAPTAQDVGHKLGQQWIHEGNNVYSLISVSGGIANWVALGNSPNPAVETISGNDGTPNQPVNGNITLQGIFPIQTQGTGSGVIEIDVLGYIFGHLISSGNAPQNIASYSMPSTPASIYFQVTASGYEETTGDAGGYTLWGLASTDGATGTLIGSNIVYSQFNGVMSGADFTVQVAGNSLEFFVTGIPLDNVIWTCIGTINDSNYSSV